MIVFSLSEIPAGPGLYVLRDRNGHVAYVGISNNVRSRVDQHLYRRDSSIATGVSTTSLNPDYVTRVDWWVDPLFEDKASREAAEVVAFEVFNPALRSRGNLSAAAQQILQGGDVCARVSDVLRKPPHGAHTPRNLHNLCAIVGRLAEETEGIKERVAHFERGR